MSAKNRIAGAGLSRRNRWGGRSLALILPVVVLACGDSRDPRGDEGNNAFSLADSRYRECIAGAAASLAANPSPTSEVVEHVRRLCWESTGAHFPMLMFGWDDEGNLVPVVSPSASTVGYGVRNKNAGETKVGPGDLAFMPKFFVSGAIQFNFEYNEDGGLARIIPTVRRDGEGSGIHKPGQAELIEEMAPDS